MRKIFIISLLIYSTLYGVMVENKVLKQRISNELYEEFKDDFSIWGVELDKDTLTIRFTKNYLWKKRSYGELQRSFQVILKDFYPRYLKYVIAYKENIEQVEILGYTSSQNERGDTAKEKYLRNLIISQENVDLIFDYIQRLPDDIIIENKQWIEEHTKAIGKSSSNLIYDKNHKEDIKRSNRIEFKIVLKKIESTDEEYVDMVPEIKHKNISTKLINLDTNVSNENKHILLSNYVKKLLLQNPTINQQQQLVNSLEEDINIAKALFRPTVSLDVKYTRYSESTSDDKINSFERSVSLKYNLFNKFNDTLDKKIKEENYKATKFTKNQKELDLIYSVVEAFINLKKQHEVLVLSKKNIGDYDRWLAKEDIKFQNGLTTLRDYAKIKSRYITQKMNYEELQRVYMDNMATMQKYIDFDITDIIYFEELNPQSGYFDNIDLSKDDMMIYSPYIQEAVANIDMYKSKLDRAKVNFYPTVDLIARKTLLDDSYKDETRDASSEERSIMIEAKLDLYSGGKDLADENKKRFEYREKLLKKDEVVRDMIYKIDLGFNKYNLAKTKMDYLKDLIEQRESSFIGANYDYKFAKIDANGLLDAVDDLYNAKKLYIENKYNFILSKYKILTDIGTIKDDIVYE